MKEYNWLTVINSCYCLSSRRRGLHYEMLRESPILGHPSGISRQFISHLCLWRHQRIMQKRGESSKTLNYGSVHVWFLKGRILLLSMISFRAWPTNIYLYILFCITYKNWQIKPIYNIYYHFYGNLFIVIEYSCDL